MLIMYKMKEKVHINLNPIRCTNICINLKTISCKVNRMLTKVYVGHVFACGLLPYGCEFPSGVIVHYNPYNMHI